MNTREQILDQLYLTSTDLMLLIPNLTYKEAIYHINEVREEMKQKGFYIPRTRKYLALTKLLKKRLGF